MPVTTNADGLSVVHKGSGGVAKSTQPDVCLTTIGPSVVPVCYDNVAKSEDLLDGSSTVTMDGGNSIAIQGCQFSKSTGDADGDQKGVSSGTIEDKAEFISWSSTVKIEGKGVCRLSDQMTMNAGNTSCMGGVQNPSVSAEVEEEPDYDLDIFCNYPDGEPLQNARYTLSSAAGETLDKNQLDQEGCATSYQLPNVQCQINYQEDGREYTVRQTRQPNPRQKEYDNESFFSLCAGRRQPFWRPQSARSNQSDWGQFTFPLYADRQFCDCVALQWMSLSTWSVSELECKKLTDFLLTLIGALPLSQSSGAEKLSVSEDKRRNLVLGLMHLLAPIVDANGIALKIFTDIDPSESYHRLMAVLRAKGYGNPVQLVEYYDWQKACHPLLAHLDQLLHLVMVRLQSLQSHADTLRYTVLAQRYGRCIKQIQQLKNALPDWVKQASQQIKSKLDQIKAANPKVDVTASPNTVFSSTAGSVHSQVFTLNNYKKLSFEDPQERVFRVGVFFDGTGQNLYNDIYKETHGNKSQSNIGRLYQAYPAVEGEIGRIYVSGVGTFDLDPKEMSPEEIHARIDAGTDEVGTGEAFAIAPEDLVTEHIVPNKYLEEKTGGFYKWQSLLKQLHDRLTAAKNQYDDVARVEFDVFGFSRGAALARHFVNAVQQGLPNYDRKGTGSSGSAITPNLLDGFEDHRVDTNTGYQKDNLREVSVRFVGLYDTVGSFYWPGHEDNGNFQLGLAPDCAKMVVQLCAYHEYRKNFPLTALKTNGELPNNFYQEMFPGAHSDVGGGYVHLKQYYNTTLPIRYQQPVLDTYNRDLVKTESLQSEYDNERRQAPNSSMGKDRADRMIEHTRQEQEKLWDQQQQEDQFYGKVKSVNWTLYYYRLQPVSNALAGLSQERMKQLAELAGVQWSNSQYHLPEDYPESPIRQLWSTLNTKEVGNIQQSDWWDVISPIEHQFVHRPHDCLINPGWSNTKDYLVNRPTYNDDGKLKRQVFDNVY